MINFSKVKYSNILRSLGKIPVYCCCHKEANSDYFVFKMRENSE